MGLDDPGFESKQGEENFPFSKKSRLALQKVKTGFRAHPAGTMFYSREKSGWGVDLTAHFLIIPRLEMSGALAVLPR
jgi:hypothetical protein